MPRKTYYAVCSRPRMEMTYTPGKVIGSTEIRISQEFDGPEAASTTAGIQEAIADLPAEGGAILVPLTRQTISGTITLDKDNVKIFGEGVASVIYLADGSDCDMIDLQGHANIEIANLKMDGNKAAQASGSGIVGVDNQNLNLDRVYVHDMKDYGVFIDYDTTNPYVEIRDCDIHDCDREGIIIESGTHCHIAGNHLGGDLVGVFLQNGYFNRVVDNSVVLSGESGIVIGIEFGDIVEGNTCTANTEHGVVIHTCSQITISNNVCFLNLYDNIYIYRTIHSNIKGNNAINAGAMYNGIHVVGDVGDDADNNIIEGNFCNNTGIGQQDIGIYIEGGQYARDNILRNNQCLGNIAAGIIDGGERTERYVGHCESFLDVRAELANFIHQCAGTGAAFTVLAPAFTGAQLEVARNVTVDCTNLGGPTGDILISGRDAFGRTVNEAITVTPGGQTVGNVAFSFVVAIDVPATIPAADTIQVGNGSKLGLVNRFFDATYSIYKINKNNTDYSTVATHFTPDTDYFTVDVSTGGGIVNGDDFTIWYRTDMNQVV